MFGCSAFFAIFFSLIGVGHTFFNLKLNGWPNSATVSAPWGKSKGLFFELLTRLWVLVLAMGIACWSGAVADVPAQFENVMRSVVRPTEEDPQLVLTESFFGAVDSIYDNVDTLDSWHFISYLVVVLQIAQLVCYFHAHPRLGLITNTIMNTMMTLLHFAFLSILIFMMLTFMVYWAFGSELEAFRTFGRAATAQLNMIYGDYIYAKGASELDDSTSFMYWLYALTFMILVFFLAVDFLVAVALDAFTEAKGRAKAATTSRNAISDAFTSVWAMVIARRNRFPPAQDLVNWLKGDDSRWSALPDDGPQGEAVVNYEALVEAFGVGLEDQSDEDEEKAKQALQAFVVYYMTQFPELLLSAGPTDQEPLSPSTPVKADSRAPGAAVKKEDGPGDPYKNLERNKSQIAQRIVHEVTSQLAAKDLNEVDWLNMASRLSCSLYREFRLNGAIA